MANEQFYPRSSAITTSDTVNIDGTTYSASSAYKTPPAAALYVGGAGNAVVVMENGATNTYLGLTAGEILPVRFIRINASSTTATSLVALYDTP